MHGTGWRVLHSRSTFWVASVIGAVYIRLNNGCIEVAHIRPEYIRVAGYVPARCDDFFRGYADYGFPSEYA